MKFNIKSLLGAVALCTGLVANATVPPAFSTAEAPAYNQVVFSTGGHCLKDTGAGQRLQTANVAGGPEFRWQLIGDAENFKMKSAAGRYIGYESSSNRFTAVADEANAIELHLKDMNGYWEICRKGVTNKAINQCGGTGVGVQICEWNTGDTNNKLNFVYPTDPEFVADDTAEPTWYYIQFKQNNSVIESQGVGNSVKRVIGPMPVANKLWKLVGNRNNFQIVNKKGEYLVIQGTGTGARVKASATPYAAGYSLIQTPANSHWPAFEIKDNDTKNCFNLWQGAGAAAQEVGIYGSSAGENGNALTFKSLEDIPPVEFNYEGSTTYRPEHKLSLWYTRPGTTSTYVLNSYDQKWMDLGLPVGNGQLGATVLGGVYEEEISVNEKTLWTGTKEQKNAPYGCYQNFGLIKVSSLEEEGFGWEEENAIKNYWRNLDLTDATSNVSYENAAGTVFERHFIASYPDQVIAALFTASTPGAINVKFSETPGMDRSFVTRPVQYSADGTITYGGKFETVSFAKYVKIIPTGGTMTADATGITIKGADQIYVVISAATDYDLHTPTFTSGTDQLVSKVESIANAAATKGWDAVYSDHVADYQSFFNRVDFELAGAVNDKPTDELITYYQNTTADNINADDNNIRFLEQLYFHYGRYLHIGSSRGIDVPNNLQGIWSGFTFDRPYSGQIAPWNADIHNNINLQMCYWPAEPTNLSELHLPMLNYLIGQVGEHTLWQEFARDSGQTKGWTFYTESSIFGGTGNFMHNYTIANAWCCSHMFQHYDYTLDKEFLLKAFPTIWSCCEFWMERLVKGEDGTWEAPNEYSPEHGPGSQNATAHAQQILVDLFSNTIKAINTLGVEACGITAADKAKLESYYDNLDKGLATEVFDGQWQNANLQNGDQLLREWKYSPYTAGANGHRHMSHLMALYPYSQIEPGHPMYQPAVNSMILRGDGATGWSMGWKINLWARAQDGDHARKILRNALCSTHRNGSGVYNNLFDSHSPFQIDGNFGACSGIAEMLLQSRNGGIYMLPALPSTWNEGEVNGLKAAGDVTYSATWKNGRIETANLVANQGGDLKVGQNDILNLRVFHNGVELNKPLVTVNQLTGTKTVDLKDLKPGDNISFVYDPEYTNPNVTVQTGVEEVATAAKGISVSNGKVIAPEAVSIAVYDVTGRQIAAVAASEMQLPAASGVVVVKATKASGAVETLKTVM